eukprot:jgi/Mesvir1/16159/Mv08428-RA.2
MLKATKPKTAAGRRALKKREPKREETFKRLLLLHGTSTSQVVKNALTDMYHLTRPGGLAVRFTRKNADILPFEPGKELSLEFLAEKSDCGLFLYGSHSKKRPHNLILGRMYDAHILDMVELELASFLPIQHFGAAGSHAQEGSKPCIVFQGEDFETKTEFRLLKSLLVDTLRGLVVKAVNLAGVDRVYVCSAVNGQVMLRHYVIRLKKSGTKIPRVELEEMGPRMDLRVRRTREAPPDLRKEAYRTAAMETKKKVCGSWAFWLHVCGWSRCVGAGGGDQEHGRSRNHQRVTAPRPARPYQLLLYGMVLVLSAMASVEMQCLTTRTYRSAERPACGSLGMSFYLGLTWNYLVCFILLYSSVEDVDSHLSRLRVH